MKGHVILIKRNIQQDDILNLSIYAPEAKILTFLKETLLKFKSHIKPHTLIVGEFNSQLVMICICLGQGVALLGDLIVEGVPL